MFRRHPRLFAALLALAPVTASAAVVETDLVSDGATKAAFKDPNLINPWGISYSPLGEFWVSDNGTGLTTLYNTSGMPQSLVVAIPGAGGVAGAPTGQVFNSTSGFQVTEKKKSGPSAFIFATENGTLSGWAPNVDGTHAINAVDNSASGAVYKGLAIVTQQSGTFLLAANFMAQQVEVYDSTWHLVRSFRDSDLPANYSPFNVAVLNGNIYVSYAKHKKGSKDETDGRHFGAVEQVDIDGNVIRTIAIRGALNAPWGMAIAPTSFGPFAGALLVGNFGDGTINGFDPNTGKKLGALKTADGKTLAIDGLWGLIPGNGGQGGNSKSLYFSAGTNGEADGLFGALDWQ